MGKDVSQVRHEVEAARQEVADAVEALVYKLNAPKRLKQRVASSVRTAKDITAAKASDAKEQVSARVGDLGGSGHDGATGDPTVTEKPRQQAPAMADPQGNLP
jgi:hypothetical protein